jgi:hyperosmotically inducible periplasmic protein
MNTSFRKLALASAIALAMFASNGDAFTSPATQQITDARHEAQIWTTYALSPHLRATDISVDVKSGVATLTGEVPDDINKELANEIALGVNGVSKVDNRIVVKDDFKPAPRKDRSYGDIIDDATVTAAVKSKLLWSKHASGLSTHVTTTSGKVVLEGTAESAEAKAFAASIAANTRGATSVDNRLTVTPPAAPASGTARASVDDAGQGMADGWITTKVKSTFMYSSNVSGSDISVNTDAGVVTLTGKVDSGAERALAIELAQNIRGVRSVNSKGLTL